MSARFPNDPIDALCAAHDWIGLIAHRFNRAGAGLLDRLDAAIGNSIQIADDSLAALHLARDAATLRALADALDERREALTGRAPRLRLIAAE